MVVMVAELDQCQAEFLDIAEVPHPEELFFQGAEKTFDAAVAFRLPHECRRRGDTQEGNLGLKVVAHIQIIQENKARLQFFQEKLEHQADQETALKFLQEKYEAFLMGVIAEEQAADGEGDDAGDQDENDTGPKHP